MTRKWKTREVLLPGEQKRKIKVRAPILWSDIAVQIAAHKYLRDADQNDLEKLFHRMAKTWSDFGRQQKYFASLKDQKSFYEQIMDALYDQAFAPNSPQWFNTGLYHIYKIQGDNAGLWFYNEKKAKLEQAQGAYKRPQIHACFIQSLEDSLVGPDGLMDLWTKEARLFKFGSGSGTNFSTLRGRGEPLSAGGQSSGLLSFLKVGDRSAGAIKSGGTTRRAAKMVIVDLDHPDILEFVRWKAQEELKVCAMITGGVALHRLQWFSEQLAQARMTEIQFNEGVRDLFLPTHLVQAVRAQALEGEIFLAPLYDESFEGEAYTTVSGQNANHSVRVSDKFLTALKKDQLWTLNGRAQKKFKKKIKAKVLWEEVCQAAWQSADPGVQFSDTINAWHTCPLGGEIRASNPCSEYFFLDNTACNLASLNLLKFWDEKESRFKLDDFLAAVEMAVIVLDISVGLASYPSEKIAWESYAYRTLGLGLTNMGAFLMAQGIAYDSDQGRAYLQVVTSLMAAKAWQTSAYLAKKHGPFIHYSKNRLSLKRALENHARAAKGMSRGYSKLNVNPWPQRKEERFHDLCLEAIAQWDEALKAISRFGARNAQTTLMAPTGTISLVMDCDTTGIEPDFALLKTKKLAGGGKMILHNQQIDSGLKSLGYDEEKREAILAYLKDHGELHGAPYLQLKDFDVFACAHEISPLGHLKMVAAVQSFLCGGISKTINLPENATRSQISEVYLKAHEWGVKSVSVYRSGSKLSEPLSKGQNQGQLFECAHCGSLEVVRAGTCVLCRECGQSSSC